MLLLLLVEVASHDFCSKRKSLSRITDIAGSSLRIQGFQSIKATYFGAIPEEETAKFQRQSSVQSSSSSNWNRTTAAHQNTPAAACVRPRILVPRAFEQCSECWGLPHVSCRAFLFCLKAINIIKSTVQFLSLKINHAELFRQENIPGFFLGLLFWFGFCFNSFEFAIVFQYISFPSFHPHSSDFCLDSCLPNHFMMLLLSYFCFFHYPSTKEKGICW